MPTEPDQFAIFILQFSICNVSNAQIWCIDGHK
jgi:hypothetical protein